MGVRRFLRRRAYTNCFRLCALVQAPQTNTRPPKDFLSVATSKENAEEGSKSDGEFVPCGNLTKAPKIAKDVRR